MNITLNRPNPCGTIDAISSKSHAHRLFICAAFADKPTAIICRTINEDICATIRCLNSLGANIRKISAETYEVVPVAALQCETAILDCGESGSTLRFMLPVALAAGLNADFVCRGRLPERPLSPLYEQLVSHGARLSEKGSNPIKSREKITGGKYSLSGGVSSQFVTGLLLGLPLTGENSQIHLTGKLESRPYIDITLRALSDFGIKVCEKSEAFEIPAGRYISPGKISVEGDWSNAAFFLVCGAFSAHGVTVRGLDTDSPQGDRAITKLLAGFGAEVSSSTAKNCITVKRGELSLHAPDKPVDASDIPDLIPVVAVMAAVAEGTTVIKNCARLRLKESDRLATIHSTLDSLGADIQISDDTLIINGKPKLRGGTVASHGDHRIAMAAAVAAVVSEGAVTICGAEAVGKSYPAFFEDFYKLCEDNT